MVYAEYTWIFVCSIFLSTFVAYGIGANDVGNAFGSSVGAKALTIKQAIVVCNTTYGAITPKLQAAFCEFFGAFLMGAGVTETIKGGIADVNAYMYAPSLLMYGMMCALLSAGLWIILATYWELPVSTTHSIVGAVVGFSLIAAGPNSVLWSSSIPTFPFIAGMSAISLSWVFSPILSGFFAIILFLITRHCVLRRKHSFDLALWSFPVYAFLTFWIITYFIIKKGGLAFGWQNTPDYVAAYYAAWVAGTVMLIAGTLGIKFIRYRVELDVIAIEEENIAKEAKLNISNDSLENDDHTVADHDIAPGKLKQQLSKTPSKFFVAAPRSDVATPLMLQNMRKSRVWGALTYGSNFKIHDIIEQDEKIQDIHANSERFSDKTELCFKYLQVFTACANSFAHGSNDVANAMGPFAAIYSIWQCICVTNSAAVPAWILALGGLGIVLGLATFGYKIMQVLGVKMTRLTNSRGFCVELAAAITVILGSRYGLPLSTTHCIVGAVTGIGILEGSKGFNAILLVKFFLGWVATLIVAGFTSAAFMAQGIYSPNFFAPDAQLTAALAAAAPVSAPAPAPIVG